MNDTTKWKSASDKEIYTIAKNWAKKYTMKQLRGFQENYTALMKSLNGVERSEMMKRWQCVTWAIDIKAFDKYTTGAKL